MIPALIAVGALALSTGVVAADAAHHHPYEKAVVVERTAHAAPAPRRPIYERMSLNSGRAPVTARFDSARSWTPNTVLGEHNSFDANQG